jgi:hypothetical protein
LVENWLTSLKVFRKREGGKMEKDKTCFVIGPIGEPKTEIREWADKILKYVIQPALTKCGYANPIRSDQISKSGLITFEIVQHLILDDLVIADLTGRNANVYYELGILHAARKPFVQVIREGEEIPFDTKDLRTIKIGTDVEVAAKASSELETYIPEVEKLGDKINTPVSVVAEIEVLRTSGRSQEQAVGELLSKIEDIRSSIVGFGLKLDSISLSNPDFSIGAKSFFGHSPLCSLFSPHGSSVYEISPLSKDINTYHRPTYVTLIPVEPLKDAPKPTPEKQPPSQEKNG